MPRTIEEVRGAASGVFDRIDSLDDLARAAAVSPAAEEARRATMPQRPAVGPRLAELQGPANAAEDRERIARLMANLVTTDSVRMWRNHFGLSVDEAADAIDWVLRAALAAAVTEEDR